VRVVVATTTDDPWAEVFWGSYYRAGGIPPVAVCFLRPRRKAPVWKTALEGLLLFGPLGGAGAWMASQRTRAILERRPEQIFAGTTQFHRLSTLNKGEGFQFLERAAPDLFISAGSPEIFKAPVLRLATVGAVNVHNGRLPAYRGLFGSFWEAFKGEEWGYASVHVMAAEVDAGPVLAQGAVRLAGRSLPDVLAAKKQLGGKLLAWLVRYVEKVEGFPPPCPQAPRDTPGYYTWPSLREMGALTLKRLRPWSRRPAAGGPPVDTWPVEVALGDK